MNHIDLKLMTLQSWDDNSLPRRQGFIRIAAQAPHPLSHAPSK